MFKGQLYTQSQSIKKSERETQIPYDSTYMWNLKYDTNECSYKTETDSETWKTNLCLPKGKRG